MRRFLPSRSSQPSVWQNLMQSPWSRLAQGLAPPRAPCRAWPPLALPLPHLCSLSPRPHVLGRAESTLTSSSASLAQSGNSFPISLWALHKPGTPAALISETEQHTTAPHPEPNAFLVQCQPEASRVPSTFLPHVTDSPLPHSWQRGDPESSDSRRATASPAGSRAALPPALGATAQGHGERLPEVAEGRGLPKSPQAGPRCPCCAAHGVCYHSPRPCWAGLCVFLALGAGTWGYVSR